MLQNSKSLESLKNSQKHPSGIYKNTKIFSVKQMRTSGTEANLNKFLLKSNSSVSFGNSGITTSFSQKDLLLQQHLKGNRNAQNQAEICSAKRLLPVHRK